ncbi:uncharacterized protein PV07_11294 [Cladophialophora immunda]|uniref:VOC domain-containing protein n=1 Tax=Cladophialophora immunda TaxID=569365 RepID=A0A0D2ADU6_9EURO|nr:uncharacterized protein PV07_11294 [Cladophialophora immunda]KIW23062.1 hypothetical protein PV07_11294 [Cladophialophora immunda]
MSQVAFPALERLDQIISLTIRQAGSTPLNLNFNHLGIAVPDCGEAAKWYAENLGFRVVTALPIYINRDDEPDHPVFDIYPAHLREVKIMVLNMGNNIAFEIFEFIDPKMEHPATFDITRGGMFHFAITHPYPDELCERIIAAGGKKIGKTVCRSPPDSALYVQDPWGNVIEVLSAGFAAGWVKLRAG